MGPKNVKLLSALKFLSKPVHFEPLRQKKSHLAKINSTDADNVLQKLHYGGRRYESAEAEILVTNSP